MKKIILASLLALSFINVAHADRWRHGGGAYYYHPSYGWVAPAIIGGAIVYEATRPPNCCRATATSLHSTSVSSCRSGISSTGRLSLGSHSRCWL